MVQGVVESQSQHEAGSLLAARCSWLQQRTVSTKLRHEARVLSCPSGGLAPPPLGELFGRAIEALALQAAHVEDPFHGWYGL